MAHLLGILCPYRKRVRVPISELSEGKHEENPFDLLVEVVPQLPFETAWDSSLKDYQKWQEQYGWTNGNNFLEEPQMYQLTSLYNKYIYIYFIGSTAGNWI